MKLNVLENPKSIKMADNNFFRLLKDSSVKFGRISVIYEFFDSFGVRNFHEDVNVYSLKEKISGFHTLKRTKDHSTHLGLMNLN